MTRLRGFDLVVLGALAAVVTVVAVVALATVPDRRLPTRDRAPALGGRPVGVGVEARAISTLHAWDDARADAYAEDSPRRLRDLYVAGSPAGAADLRLLHSYHARGLRIVGLHTQVLALGPAASTADRCRLRVTDRPVGASVERGGRRRLLPQVRAQTHDLTLLLGADGRWRMEQVRTAG